MTEVAKERSQVVAELNEYKNEAMKEYSELENKMIVCASQLEAREDLLCESAVKRELAEFEKQVYQSDLEPCKSQLSAITKQNYALQADLKKKQLELAKALAEKAKALAEKEKKAQELSATRHMYLMYKERLTETETDVKRLTKEKAAMESKLTKEKAAMEKEVATLEKTLTLTMAERAACLDEVEELKNGHQACAVLVKEKDKALMAEQKKFWATLAKLDKC